MLVTVSTILDTPTNVEQLVRGNTASGVDHMVVVLDAPGAPGQDEVAALLDQHPHVTCLAADTTWWAGDRPRQLNVRQRINANLVLHVLDGVPEAEWLFHLDGDETAVLDRDALAAVPVGTDSVWLSPWEAVSRLEVDGRPTAFKPLLDDDDLQLLTVLGVIDEPTNQAYFHGHLLGKSGVRPGSGLRLALHDPVDAQGRRVPLEQRHRDDRLHVLHYDAVSGAEFVRKWSAMVAAGPVALRPDRAPLARALRTLLGKDLDDAARTAILERLYVATTQDDVETLEALGLLRHVDPLQGASRARTFGPESAALFARRLDDVRAEPKRRFHVNHGGRRDAAGDAGGAVDEAATDTGDQPGALSRLRRRLGPGD